MIEVLRNPEAEQLRRADDDMRIPRKIQIELEGIEHRRQKLRRAGGILRPFHTDDIGDKVICNHQLLKQPPGSDLQTVCDRLIIKRPYLSKLRQHLPCPQNRPAADGWKKGNEQRHRQRILLHRKLSACHRQHIGDALQGEERNPKRQEESAGQDSRKRQQIAKVFEQKKRQEQTEHGNPFFHPRRLFCKKEPETPCRCAFVEQDGHKQDARIGIEHKPCQKQQRLRIDRDSLLILPQKTDSAEIQYKQNQNKCAVQLCVNRHPPSPLPHKELRNRHT